VSIGVTSNSDFSRVVLTEPGVRDARHYTRRVRRLAIVHPCLFLASLAGLAILVWRSALFVTLSQRSNVETLTIAFFLLFFAYFAVVSVGGAVGAARIVLSRLGVRPDLGQRHDGPSAAFDRIIEAEGGGPWEVEVRDAHGSMGRLRVDGVRVTHLDAFRRGSNSLLGFLEQRIVDETGEAVEIVQWSSTGREDLLQYCAMASALRATWPRVVIREDARVRIERELSGLCPALRDEALLPDWEFEGEHKLPIIPEPLGIVSLSRTERRVDPLSSMTAVLVVVLVVVALLCLFVWRPPWVPAR
jgi:hypothetical protein